MHMQREMIKKSNSPFVRLPLHLTESMRLSTCTKIQINVGNSRLNNGEKYVKITYVPTNNKNKIKKYVKHEGVMEQYRIYVT